jgi:hypothetical protein
LAPMKSSSWGLRASKAASLYGHMRQDAYFEASSSNKRRNSAISSWTIVKRCSGYENLPILPR